MSEIVYRIEHKTKCLFWSSIHGDILRDGFWSETDDFAVLFSDDEEEHKRAEEMAGSLGGVVSQYVRFN